MKKFSTVAADVDNPNWQFFIERKKPLYQRENELRSPFMRDYTRILHSFAYRRLKHKTQVFFNADNDHVCTRIEHVTHVDSVSSTIARALGLNEDLTRAIAIGHDLGHAPFGHQGEEIIDELIKEYNKSIGEGADSIDSFWHEKNGLLFVDEVELLEDSDNFYRNLNLTYAVRDGIISHCGEVNENGIAPRNERIDLYSFKNAGQYQPYTWEGCVVKISDKIAYLGRDIEDAISLGFLYQQARSVFLDVMKKTDQEVINTTNIIYTLINDICDNSSPSAGIRLSKKSFDLIQSVKHYNEDYIYKHKRFKAYKNYAHLVIKEIYDFLSDLAPEIDAGLFWNELKQMEQYYPTLIKSFELHISKYCDIAFIPESCTDLRSNSQKCLNDKIYGCLDTRKKYISAIINYISGMTDRFALKLFEELIHF